ncbi:hypothetical protein XENOCAPTIV_024454, partial [Xenoophorus captivus]
VEEESCPVPSGRREEDRLDRQKVADFLREAETIRIQIGKLENKRPLTTLCRKTIGADVTNELEEYEKTLEKERTAQKMNLQKQLVKIHNDVQKFQRHLNDVTATPESIERLKEKASEVEGSINALKEERRLCFKEYLKEERTCSQEVTAYEKKTENWSLPFNSNPKLPAAPALKVWLSGNLHHSVFSLLSVTHLNKGKGWRAKFFVCSLRPNPPTETYRQRSKLWRISCRRQKVLMEAGTNWITKRS